MLLRVSATETDARVSFQSPKRFLVVGVMALAASSSRRGASTQSAGTTTCSPFWSRAVIEFWRDHAIMTRQVVVPTRCFPVAHMVELAPPTGAD
jgi:hypothetical protein